jgi:hypothetical protein
MTKQKVIISIIQDDIGTSNDTIEAKSNKSKIDEELSDQRMVPKSTNPETRTLLVTNLQRPFVNSALQDLLNSKHKYVRMWIDFIKTHCYVEVSNIPLYSTKL